MNVNYPTNQLSAGGNNKKELSEKQKEAFKKYTKTNLLTGENKELVKMLKPETGCPMRLNVVYWLQTSLPPISEVPNPLLSFRFFFYVGQTNRPIDRYWEHIENKMPIERMYYMHIEYPELMDAVEE